MTANEPWDTPKAPLPAPREGIGDGALETKPPLGALT